MKQDAFHRELIALWTGSTMPLTLTNVVATTGETPKRAQKHLDALTSSGVIEMEVGDGGAIHWTLPDARRPIFGAATPNAWQQRALTAAGKEQRSMTLSAILSFFFGPLGWLYAAPMNVAIPGSVIYVLACGIVPTFVLAYVLGITAPITAILGAAWAWKFNKHGKRTPLLDPALDNGPRQLP